MPNLLDILLKLRDIIWQYPDIIGSRINQPVNFFIKLYNSTKPLSFIVSLGIIIVLFTNYLPGYVSGNIEKSFTENNKIVEGVSIRPEDYPKSFNPLFPTVNQLEKDIRKLVFSSMFDIDKNGNPVPDIVETWNESEDGLTINFQIRDDVFWHDGQKLTVDDIEFTFGLLEEYTNDSTFGNLTDNIEFEKTDNRNFRFKLNEISPILFENLNWGILPVHILGDLSPNEIKRSAYNLAPIGSGPYSVESITDKSIILTANKMYSNGPLAIKEIEFRLYNNEESLMNDFKLGKINSLHSISDENIDLISSQYKNFTVKKSDPLYKRYWAIYFNLADNTKEELKDKRIRKAISVGINKQSLIEKGLNGNGEVAYGPIYPKSWAYNIDYYKDIYDIENSNKILDAAGWKLSEGEILRKKDGKVLELDLYVIDDENKIKIAEEIKHQLERIGVNINVIPKTNIDLINNHIATRNFDMLLYGIETSLDPDHYKLWHSSQVNFPGLNISSFKSDIVDGRTGESRLDISLVNARKEKDQTKRKEMYYDVQKYITDDYPVVFLYYPIFNYVINNRIHNVDVKNIGVPEARFDNVEEWYIE